MANRVDRTEIEQFVIDRVKEMRVKAGLSQAKLALESEISVGFIGNVESPNHRAKYNLNHINKFVTVFNCSFADFFPIKAFESESDVADNLNL